MMWVVRAVRLPGIDFDRIRPNGQPASWASAFEAEPKRYFAALPIDRPAGDTAAGGTKKESAYTRWARKVAE